MKRIAAASRCDFRGRGLWHRLAAGGTISAGITSGWQTRAGGGLRGSTVRPGPSRSCGSAGPLPPITEPLPRRLFSPCISPGRAGILVGSLCVNTTDTLGGQALYLPRSMAPLGVAPWPFT